MTKPDLTRSVIVAGCGRTLWRDLRRCPLGTPVIAVNDAGLYIPSLAHMASYHARVIGLLAQLRAVQVPRVDGTARDLTPPEVHSTAAAPGVTRVWSEQDGGGGSSSLFAVRVALGLGYTHVILAGVPLDDRGHFYDAEGSGPWQDFGSTTYLDAWTRAAPDLAGRVFSCSGMTKTLLGGLPE